MLRVGFKKTTTIQQNSHSEMKWAEIWKKKQNKVQYIHSWEALFLRLIAQLFLQF